ncbi:hypothetical protein SADUNF_Sadunf05G0047100 [Salix dunnii]|uniref:Uncharacterized protein n=1 Tax=Salix dunnii TaxID=1413687 RepID=A0A835N3I7_9ROSI|nr:hypothetical protein SADUNF_Sadunf05G0047100 [Salix dunnii]
MLGGDYMPANKGVCSIHNHQDCIWQHRQYSTCSSCVSGAQFRCSFWSWLLQKWYRLCILNGFMLFLFTHMMEPPLEQYEIVDEEIEISEVPVDLSKPLLEGAE